MKILAIGDPHGDLKKIKKIPVKNIDLILLTGDIGKADLARQKFFENSRRKKQGLSELEWNAESNKSAHIEIYNSTLDVLKYLSKYVPVYSIIGNVGGNMLSDSKVKKDEDKYKIKLPYLGKEIKKLNNFHFIRNKIRNFNNLRIGFLEYFTDTCWIKEFNEKDKKIIKKAKKGTEKAKRILNGFGRNLDVLICHQPPYGYLDKVTWAKAPKHYSGKHAGSRVILNYIRQYKPRYVFCGHIHEGKGKAKIGKTEIYNLGVAGHKIISLPTN